MIFFNKLIEINAIKVLLMLIPISLLPSDTKLEEYKIREMDVTKIVTEVVVAKREAEIVSIHMFLLQVFQNQLSII